MNIRIDREAVIADVKRCQSVLAAAAPVFSVAEETLYVRRYSEMLCSDRLSSSLALGELTADPEAAFPESFRGATKRSSPEETAYPESLPAATLNPQSSSGTAFNTSYSLPGAHEPWNNYSSFLDSGYGSGPSLAQLNHPSNVGYTQHGGSMAGEGMGSSLPLTWDEGFLAFWAQTTSQYPSLAPSIPEDAVGDVTGWDFGVSRG
jgi:hypothetical protein